LTRSNFRIDDRSRSILRCAQVRIKVRRKNYGWFVRIVYDSRVLSGVTIVRSRVAGVLQMVSELTFVISRTHTGQLRRIR
jgi:hypothetical protein